MRSLSVLPLLVLLSAAAPAPPRLALPIACSPGSDCFLQNHVDRDPGLGVSDFRCGAQTYEAHTGTDIRLVNDAARLRGVDVLAAAPGRVVRLRDGEPDISVKAPGAPPVAGRECGNGVVIDHGGGWETQSCHLARGSIRVRVGQEVAAGQPIARVGLSGNTEYPHLHLTVRQGTRTVDPFLPDTGAACSARADGSGLWTSAAAAALAYRPGGAVLNAGFADGPVDNARVEAGGPPRPGRTSPALVAYVRAINLTGGDRPVLTLTGPDGKVLARSESAPLDRSKAQWLVYVGKRTPPGGWPPGLYRADYAVLRNNQPVLTRRFDLRL
ncbi:MAG: M23 family metallopeptidase [Phenylobacterium sp.]|uniref:M23 family metallopeptidase n=1 Tax=Phenylobacterium sp. TaxID=1871053 RepID=UPI0025E364DE|nr:M23 family metallopeptidase [Phenylobacterium sp.]MCA6285975.1 M23 family metallopeptidase [Phenylobacterium sp.]MCA6324964.1 M23 family metallopeptidase [Phenylobacterium sp.]MCA6338320.1 M23 family metallopeptidase [Phenylobacterium sp.]MCA6357729.1 M23 family metallopeptidase [Phenylobacterium sp.]